MSAHCDRRWSNTYWLKIYTSWSNRALRLVRGRSDVLLEPRCLGEFGELPARKWRMDDECLGLDLPPLRRLTLPLIVKKGPSSHTQERERELHVPSLGVTNSISRGPRAVAVCVLHPGVACASCSASWSGECVPISKVWQSCSVLGITSCLVILSWWSGDDAVPHPLTRMVTWNSSVPLLLTRKIPPLDGEPFTLHVR